MECAGSWWTLHNFWILGEDQSTLIFTQYLLFITEPSFAKFDDIQRNVAWSNIETVNYLELLVCSVSKKHWALLYFPWKFKLSQEPPCVKFGSHGVERIQVQWFWRDDVIMSGQCLERHRCSVSMLGEGGRQRTRHRTRFGIIPLQINSSQCAETECFLDGPWSLQYHCHGALFLLYTHIIGR